MFSAKERLGQLLGLAAEQRWTPLARELSDLVLFWPPDWPQAMRAPMVALFETALREADDATQSELAARMGNRPEIPLRVMNALYLAAPAPVRREILMRNELEGEDAPEPGADAVAILDQARAGGRDFTVVLSQAADIPPRTAATVLRDASGESLAVLCRGTGIDRATFSAIAVLRGPKGLPLQVFDSVPDHAAQRLVHAWRKRVELSVHPAIVAA